MITCDEILEETKSVATNFNEIKQTVKQKMSIFKVLLTASNIYCHLTKYRAKEKRLLLYRVKNNKLKKSFINKCNIKMEINDELKEINIKNRTFYYLDDIFLIEDFDLDNILMCERS